MRIAKRIIRRREFLRIMTSFSISLAIPFGRARAASADQNLGPAQPGYGSGAYGSGPYGIDSYKSYLPTISQKGV